ncbi:hypothetical protein, partial [Polaromonas sp.]|uniref:hypothetical protein n=1 Tax=Polaromonas sp. TaxID=1869339 RepID=UPI002B809CC0
MGDPARGAIPVVGMVTDGRFATVMAHLDGGHCMVGQWRGFCRDRASRVAGLDVLGGLRMADLHHSHFGRHGIAHPAAQGQQGDHQGEKEGAHR